MAIPGTGTEWLIIQDVITTSPFVVSYVDHSSHLHFGDDPHGLGGNSRTNFSMMLKQRGTANIALVIGPTDSYEPGYGSQVFLYDITESPNTQTCVFCGTIDSIQTSYWGTAGWRLVVLNCVSFENVFDTIRVPGQLFLLQNAGTIFTTLFDLATGSPLTLGTVSPGPVISNFLIEDAPSIADVFDRLCVEMENTFVWNVDPTTLQVNFCAVNTFPAPFAVMQDDVVWEEVAIKFDRHDFRDRQYIKLDYDAFGRSDEVFVGAGQKSFALRNPVHQVTNAWITKNTQNTATGSFSSQPSPGDTVTISYPTSGSIYNWAALSPYFPAQTIVDPNGHLQQVSSVGSPSYPGVPGSGESGATMPVWNDAGGTTVDSGVRWQDKGPAGFGPYQVAIYSFVTVVDNTLYGQVLIGATLAETCQNLVDAINSTTATRGVGYSLPTWENPLVNADAPTGLYLTTFTLRNKYAGKGFIAAISTTSAGFSWSAAQTSGGITTFGTYALSTGVSSAASQALSYTPGSNICTLPTPLNTGTNLAVEYQRIDGDLIAVENTALVTQRAMYEQSTGKYQALTTDTSATPVQGLGEAQQALLAFQVLPSMLEFVTYRPGLRANQGVTFGFTFPQGPNLESGYPAQWSNRRAVTIGPSSYPDNLGNFVTLIAGTYPYLATIANGGQCFSNEGFDIIFTSDSLGVDLLNWEVQSYNPVTGAVIIWVAQPIGDTLATVIYMWYGSPTVSGPQSPGNAWSYQGVDLGQPNYTAVYHLKESGPAYHDSGPEQNSSTGGTYPTINPTGGVFGPSQTFGGSEYIQMPNPFVSGNWVGFTLWVKTTTSGPMGLVDTGASGTGGLQLSIDSGGHVVLTDPAEAVFVTSTGIVNDGAWHLVAAFSAAITPTGNLFVSIDGGAYDMTATSGLPVEGSANMFLGCLRGGTDFYVGDLEEFRCFDNATNLHVPGTYYFYYEWLSQTSPSSWYSIGSPTLSQAAWVIQEIEGELIPTPDNLGRNPNGPYGHYRYTVHAINVAQIGSYLDFWEGIAGGNGNITSTPAFGGTVMPPTPAAGSTLGYSTTYTSVTSLTIVHNLGTTAVTCQLWDLNGNDIIPQSKQVVDANTIAVTFGVSSSGTAVVFGVGLTL